MTVKRRQVLIGLTGGVASGKSSAAAMFRKLGAAVIDADSLARDAAKPGKPVFKRIVRSFGKDILDAKGRLNRRKLAEIVFNSSKKRKTLDSITHPGIIKDMYARAAASNKKFVVLDAPLLFEAGMAKRVDETVVVWTTSKTQIERLMLLRGLTRGQAGKRVNSQWPLAGKKKVAGYSIKNTSGLGGLGREVKIIWERLTNKYKSV